MKSALMMTVIVVASAMAVLAAVAVMLPATRQGQADIVINAPPERIIVVLEDVQAQKLWRAQVADVSLHHAGWTETKKGGEKIDFRWTLLGENRAELSFKSEAGYSGSWVATFVPVPQGIEIKATETVTIPNPFARLIARIFFDPAAFSRAYLEELKIEVERTNG